MSGTGDPASIHGWRIDRAHALAAAALCWLGFALATWLVHTGQSAPFDEMGLRFWRAGPELRPRGPLWLLEAVRDFTALGGFLLRHIVLIGAGGALVFLGLRREAALLVGTDVSGWAVCSLMKEAFGRPRPDIVPHLVEAGGSSFPSGHSFNAAVVYIAIGLAFAAMSPRRTVRWTIIGAAAAMSMLVAISRVWLGVHFPSDVLAGWLGGAGWAFAASALLYRPARAAQHAL